jgi:hypothetical protein
MDAIIRLCMPVPTLLPEEQAAEQFLRELGLDVLPVPTSTSKTPDFIVDGDARGYMLEVKARKDSKRCVDAMIRGRGAYQVRSMGHGHWAQDVARNAVKQFRSVDVQHLRWWVLWIAIRCKVSAEAMFAEVIGSFFGVRQVVYPDPRSEGAVMRDCLFATPGVFERHPEIVACIIDSGDGFGFCVNDEFAEDFDSFRESVMWSSFARPHPPTSAGDLCENLGFLRVDRSVNRKDASAVALYLEQAYDLQKAILIDMKAHSSSMVATPKTHRRV